ncbi:hypothetical protein IZU89_03525 [Cellulophaga lytica]|uniref:Secreted protein n=1 Tax=Cellulophaga geojensis KL-A TaxID=1328323 RepID=A0ABP3B546_9FLAO|nr:MULTISPECIES: hypothetical protein [Cellulophaga]AIM59571.1 hypothetical protein IX49_03195 [Cellulophaga lytica]APU09380.1 hypothetical protein A5M85_03510 [Cellulophaga lytica]EWH12596.1 hypothetical protein KLA_13881 [Cellulophaga geojensis KL-A]MDO6854799.1 hypothetical protein [Cellulophaga lytica]TVZ08919.1 hypothetical protein JM80_1423 [Cellulophaga sp. RHA_52]
MSYKLKSLVYFSCLVVAIFAYVQVDNENVLEENNNTVELQNIEENTNSNDLIVQLSEEE